MTSFSACQEKGTAPYQRGFAVHLEYVLGLLFFQVCPESLRQVDLENGELRSSEEYYTGLQALLAFAFLQFRMFAKAIHSRLTCGCREAIDWQPCIQGCIQKFQY